MPQLIRKMSARSIRGRSTIVMQPPESCKIKNKLQIHQKTPKPVSLIKAPKKTTTQEALKAIPPLLTLVRMSHIRLHNLVLISDLAFLIEGFKVCL